MGIAAQIFQHLFGTGKGTLGIDDPVFVFNLAKKLPEAFESAEGSRFSGKDQLAARVCLFQPS